MKSKGLEWKRVLKQMYRNVRWMDDDVQDVQETGHKRTSTRFMLLLDCSAGHGRREIRRPQKSNTSWYCSWVFSRYQGYRFVGTGGRSTLKQGAVGRVQGGYKRDPLISLYQYLSHHHLKNTVLLLSSSALPTF